MGKREKSSKILKTANILVLLLAVFGGGLVLGRNGRDPLVPQAKARDSIRIDLPGFSSLASELKPSVVYLVISGQDQQTDERVPKNHPKIPPESNKGVGSGFIIDQDGSILTNDHVVAEAKKVEVVIPGGQKFTAKVLGRDPQLDVALVKIDAGRTLEPVVFGDSAKARVGQWVLAMGNPFGLENNVTVGVLSGKGRELAEAPFVDFLQTDAAIYPGNSGGPLVDLDGKVLGINTAMVPGTQVGFAIPINKVKDILPQLRRGRVERGYIGIEMAPLTQLPERARTDEGVLVVRARKGGPAAKAGIQANDIIVSFDGKPVNSPNDLAKLVEESKPGEKIDVKVKRDGKELTFTVAIGRGPVPTPRN